jgi:hypothetical protein
MLQFLMLTDFGPAVTARRSEPTPRCREDVI